MKTTAKLVLGIATLIPLAYIVAVIWRINDPASFKWLLGAAKAVVALTFGLWAYYLIDVVRNKRVPREKRSLWAALILVANIVAEPVYFWLYVWPESLER